MRIPFLKRKVKKSRFTIAFYNLENLFDPIKNVRTLDSDFTPLGKKKWTLKRYHRKLSKLAKTIMKIGTHENPFPPVLIGVAEAENQGVLNDLLGTKSMKNTPYDFVHFDSPDERGIDTGLIYHTKYFKVLESEALTLIIEDAEGVRDTTRDILYVKGELNTECVHVFVNHWPSRRDGVNLSEKKRMSAAALINQKIYQLSQLESYPNIIVMGDFNDDPSSKSMNFLVEETGLYNPMTKLHNPKTKGTSTYKGEWHLFDQILMSNSFFNYEKGTHSFDMANIYDHKSLKEKEGKYKGTPYRTFVSNKYKGGYSDHFPVYAILSYNI